MSTKWSAAAAELVQAPVADAVPLARRKRGAAGFFAAGAAVFGVVVFLHEFGVIPGPTLLVFMVGAIPMAVFMQLALEPVFAVLTSTGIQMTNSSRWIPRPEAPLLGPLDPARVHGPHGLWRNTFTIAGVRHQVAITQRTRFQQMLAAASVGESAP